MPVALCSAPLMNSETELDLRSIVERSLSPDEWATIPHAEVSDRPEDRQEAERLLARWKKLAWLKTADKRAFDWRLESLDLDEAEATQRLMARQLPADVPLPAWADFLGEVFASEVWTQPVLTQAQLHNWTDEELRYRDLKPEEAALFPEFLHPFVSVALRRVRDRVVDLDAIVTAAAMEQVGRYLLVKLSTIALRVVAYEVKHRRFHGQLVGETSHERYQYFVEEVLGNPAGLASLIQQYPVLGRLLAVCSERIAECAIELLHHLQQDRADLGSTFQPRAAMGPVTSLFMGLSDSHRAGRTVCILQFASGLKLVYKPRSFEIDLAFNQLIEWLNQTGATPEMRSLKILPRPHHGWCEFIAKADCESEQQVAAFFQRHGVNAALMYFLCGVDFHYENFIAAGEYPVPIDLEAILMLGTHTAPDHLKSLPMHLQPPAILSSCMSFYWRAGDYDYPLFTASGINGCGDRPWPMLSPTIAGVGTDGLKLSRRYVTLHYNENLPGLRGKKIPVNQHIQDVVQGFAAAYRILWQHRDALLQPQGLLTAFQHLKTRALLRDTSECVGVMRWSYAPDQLISGAAYDVALEFLGNLAPMYQELQLPDLLDEEKRCCWQLDVPVLYGVPSSPYVYSIEGVPYGPVVKKVSFDHLRQRLQEASEADLTWQSELLRVSLAMATHSGGQPGPAAALAPESPKPTDDQTLSWLGIQSSSVNQQWLRFNGWSQFANPADDRPSPSKIETKPDAASLQSVVLHHAIEMGNAMVQLALRHDQGNSWLILTRNAGGTSIVSPMHPFPWMSAGAAGTSLFLANLAAHTGDARYAETARGALDFTVAMLRHCAEVDLRSHIPLSGLHGVYLPVYALTECGRRLQTDSLIDDALEITLQIPAASLQRGDNPDVLNGMAGALLVLLHLYRYRPDSRILEQATQLAERILICQRGEGAQGWWVPGFDRPLLGMAHGAAGIAYALLRLHALTGDDRLRQSALRGIAYERQHACPEAQDWPDLRQQKSKTFLTGWCAGAPGVGLARLGSLEMLADDPQIHQELEWAIAATLRHSGLYQHHLCCGDAGRIAFLAAAAQRLNRPDLAAESLYAGFKMVEYYEKKGHWRLQEFSERSIIPGLLDGIPGIGLSLLNLLDPVSTSQVWLLD
jgi:type 2 lantibiotic biosynthesis protein LanM